MAGTVLWQPPSSAVDPGAEVAGVVRIRNTGEVVDEFSASVLGDAAGWTAVEPPTLRLYPGAEGEITLRFRPPRSAELTVGAVAVGVMVRSSEDTDWTDVVEGSLQIGAFSQISARVIPRTSNGSKEGRHRIEVDNDGNKHLTVDLAAADPDEQLLIELRPDELEIAPGSSARALLRVRPRARGSGPATPRPFQVKVTPLGDVPVILDATFVQKSGNASKVLKAAGLVAAVSIVAALVAPALRNSLGSDATQRDLVQTAGSQSATASEDATDGGDGDNDGAAEDPDASDDSGDDGSSSDSGAVNSSAAGGGGAGPATGDRDGGGDGDAGGDTSASGGVDGDDGGSSGDSSGGGGTTASSTPTASGGASAGTSSTTTTAPTTTTTSVPAYKKFLGSWRNTDGSGHTITITDTGSDIQVSEPCGSSTCTDRTAYTDPNADNDLDLAFIVGFQKVTQTIFYDAKAEPDRLIVTTNSSSGTTTAFYTRPTKTTTFAPCC